MQEVKRSPKRRSLRRDPELQGSGFQDLATNRRRKTREVSGRRNERS
jgi:hypothetical protein